MTDNTVQRNFGLDIIRSIAIIMVVIGHLIPDDTTNRFAYKIAMLFRAIGVELFFVLSGFLIGKILIRLFNEGLNFSNIKRFLIRRWFRTLPLYYLYFAICIGLVVITQPGINIFSSFYYKYLFFVQNFDIRHMQFFNHSWSLSIEEWFYLLLPFVLVLIKEREKFSEIKFINIQPSNNKSLYLDLIKIIAFIIIIRFFYVAYFNITDDDFGIRRQIPIRFDVLMMGVLFACLKINNRDIFNKFLTVKSTISSFLLMCVLIFYLGHPSYCCFFKSQLFIKVFCSSLLSFSFAILIIFFENNKFINTKFLKPSFVKIFFERTSIYAYSIYLFHILIIGLYRVSFSEFYDSFVIIFFCIITIYLVSAFLYRYIEKPIMNLREKF